MMTKMTDREDKARENRARRAAFRHGLKLTKNPVRDPNAPDFNTWALLRHTGPGRRWPVAAGMTLDDVEAYLNGMH
jgi:hypothetical protein